jgi:pimeloyl-ACP methyl ester carboxylesterase
MTLPLQPSAGFARLLSWVVSGRLRPPSPPAGFASALALVLGGGLGCGPVIAGTEPWTPPSYYADESYVEVDGLKICYLEAGPPADEAETIVFVHGWSGNLQNWWDQFEHFQRRYHVVVFDAPGHGKSERGEHLDYSMELYLATLHNLLDTLGLERVIVVGNSAGGSAAAKFAIAHPERVSKLVLSNSTGTRYTGSLGAVLPLLTARWLQMAKMTTAVHYPGQDPKSVARQEFVGSFAGTVEEAPYLEALAALLPYCYERIPSEALAQIEAPTLIVWGDDDPIVPVKAMRTFEKAIEHDQSYVIHLGGHTPMMNSPDEFNCAVDAFLDERALDGCKEYALTAEKRRDRLAGHDWGPHYDY